MKYCVHIKYFLFWICLLDACLYWQNVNTDLNKKIHEEYNCIELFTALLGVHFWVIFQ